MAKNQLTGLFLVCLLTGAEAVRIDEDLDSASNTEVTCAELRAELDELGEYLPSKVNKLDTKGIDGVKGKYRIIRLGKKTNALAKAMNAFEEHGCEGDTSEVKENLQVATAKVKEMVANGEGDSAGLARAIELAERDFDAMKTMSEKQQGVAARKGLASFMRAVLSDGQVSGEVTDQEESRMMPSSISQQSHILEQAGKEDNDEEVSLLEFDGRMDLALVELKKLNATSVAEHKSGNIFWSALKGIGKFIAICVLAVVGMVWWIAHAFLIIAGYAVGWFGFIATYIVCAMWWLLGQIVEFFTVGLVSFGRDIDMCADTIFTPALAAHDALTYSWMENPPWDLMSDLAVLTQVGENVTISKAAY